MPNDAKKLLGCTFLAAYIFGLPGLMAWLTNTSWAGFLFFLFLFLFIGQIWSIRKGLRCKNWPTAEGKVIRSRIRVSPGGDSGDTYEPIIWYSFKVSDKTYESNTVSFKQNPNTTSRGLAEDVISKYPKDAILQVYYDPKKPHNSTLETGLGDGWPILLLMLFGAISLGTGICAYIVWPGFY